MYFLPKISWILKYTLAGRNSTSQVDSAAKGVTECVTAKELIKILTDTM